MYIDFPCKIEACVKKNNDLFFLLKDMNLFCSYNLKDDTSKVLSSIPDEKMFSERLCGKMLVWKNEIILLPLNAKKIHLYNLDSGTWRSITINNEHVIYKFLEGIVYKDTLYAFGHYYKSIVKVDLLNLNVEYIDISNYKGSDKDTIIGTQIVAIGDIAYLPLCNFDKIIAFNMNNNSIEEIDIDNDNKGFTAINYIDDKFFLASRIGQQIVLWNNKSIYKKIKGINSEYRGLYYHGIIPEKNEIYFPSTHENEIQIMQNEKITLNKGNSLTEFCNSISDNNYAIIDSLGNLTIFDGEEKKYNCRIEKKSVVNYIKIKSCANEDVIIEKDCFGLNSLISTII